METAAQTKDYGKQVLPSPNKMRLTNFQLELDPAWGGRRRINIMAISTEAHYVPEEAECNLYET